MEFTGVNRILLNQVPVAGHLQSGGKWGRVVETRCEEPGSATGGLGPALGPTVASFSDLSVWMPSSRSPCLTSLAISWFSSVGLGIFLSQWSPPLPAPLSPVTLTSCILVSRPLHGWCFHLSCFFLDIIFSSAVGSNYLEYFLRGNFMSVFALRNLNGHNRHIYIYMHGHGQNFKFFGLQKE